MVSVHALDAVTRNTGKAMKTPILITTSDWHLRSTVPVSRAEKSWYEVMESRFHQLRTAYPSIPIAVAGDLFDRADTPSSLVSWAISALKDFELYVIPGQHDLINHRYEDRMQGAYGALVKAGIVFDVPANTWKVVGNMRNAVAMFSMPWEHYSLPGEPALEGVPSVCLIHKYMWATAANAYVGVTDESNVSKATELMKYFNLIAVGDNHIAWQAGKFLNHGSLFSTTSAQKEHTAFLGLVYADSSYEAVRFPELEPKWQESLATEDESVTDSLATLQVTKASFREQLAAQVEHSTGQERVVYVDLLEHLVNGK